MLFNRKQDIAFGARGTYYINNWLHLLHELDFAWRKDGTQDFAQMTKFTIAPTLVPTAKRDVWERPHFRFVYSVAHYNQFAADNLYSHISPKAEPKAGDNTLEPKWNGGFGKIIANSKGIIFCRYFVFFV